MKDISVYENDHLIAGNGVGSAIISPLSDKYQTENLLLFSMTHVRHCFGIFAGFVVITKDEN